MRLCDVNKCMENELASWHVIHCPGIEGVIPTDTTSPILEIERLQLHGSFRNVPVDSLFVINILENISIVQLISDHRLQC